MGYKQAGFDEIVGIDKNLQPRYPFEFVQADALEYLAEYGEQFDFIHASPPCQKFTKYKNMRPSLPDKYPNLIPPTRELLHKTGRPFVIENVMGSPLENPLKLCGSMFDLDVQRHRLFESSVFILTMQCRHGVWEPNRFPGGRSREHGDSTALCRSTVEIGAWDIPLNVQKDAMGIDWMNLKELSEAIPPAYTQFLGGFILRSLIS